MLTFGMYVVQHGVHHGTRHAPETEKKVKRPLYACLAFHSLLRHALTRLPGSFQAD